jgi:hypothetical protein
MTEPTFGPKKDKLCSREGPQKVFKESLLQKYDNKSCYYLSSQALLNLSADKLFRLTLNLQL